MNNLKLLKLLDDMVDYIGQPYKSKKIHDDLIDRYNDIKSNYHDAVLKELDALTKNNSKKE